MLVHEYHERLDTPGMVWDRCADFEHSNTMIHTMKKSACMRQQTPDLNEVSLVVTTIYQ